MAHEEYVFAQKGQVTVSYAPESTTTPGTAGTYATIGCISGDVVVNDGRDEQTISIDDWCSGEAAGLVTATDGDRNVTVAMTLQMILSDESFKQLREDYNQTDKPGFLKIVAVDKKALATTYTNEFLVRITSFPRTFRGSDTAQVALNFRVNGIIADTLVTATS